MKKNRVALVTGAGRRLGKHIAIALAENGYDVVVNYHTSKSGAKKTVDVIRKMGRQAIAVRADVSRRVEVLRLFERLKEEFGRIDVLVNNAAVFIDSPLAKTTERIWDSTLSLNLKGTFLCCQAAAAIMQRQRRGTIINIASLGGIQAWPKHLPYSISKAGVIMLTKCLAKELAPYVSVNAIAPGTIMMNGEENHSIIHLTRKQIPLRRFGNPSDISDMAVFLASKAEYLTGQIIPIDGGRSIL